MCLIISNRYWYKARLKLLKVSIIISIKRQMRIRSNWSCNILKQTSVLWKEHPHSSKFHFFLLLTIKNSVGFRPWRSQIVLSLIYTNIKSYDYLFKMIIRRSKGRKLPLQSLKLRKLNVFLDYLILDQNVSNLCKTAKTHEYNSLADDSTCNLRRIELTNHSERIYSCSLIGIFYAAFLINGYIVTPITDR